LTEQYEAAKRVKRQREKMQDRLAEIKRKAAEKAEADFLREQREEAQKEADEARGSQGTGKIGESPAVWYDRKLIRSVRRRGNE
jgi:vacuolar-type H+-ATPase subunit H